MIEHSTVFVLGAGAHCSYGFPSGEELKAKVAKRARRHEETGDSSLNLLIAAGKCPPADVDTRQRDAFAHALEGAGQASIDAFLNSNAHRRFETIAKVMIAQILLEQEQKPPKADDDWLRYLFGLMIEGCSTLEQFMNNKVAFITFNYDRFLETWLYNCLKNSFGREPLETLKAIEAFRIRHVYGMLGPFPPPALYTGREWVDVWQGIRTIYESEHDAHAVSEMRSFIALAERVCLLGFGFHSENIQLLELPALLSGRSVAASRYNLTDTEWARIAKRIPVGIRPAENMGDKCLDTLRGAHIF